MNQESRRVRFKKKPEVNKSRATVPLKITESFCTYWTGQMTGRITIKLIAYIHSEYNWSDISHFSDWNWTGEQQLNDGIHWVHSTWVCLVIVPDIRTKQRLDSWIPNVRILLLRQDFTWSCHTVPLLKSRPPESCSVRRRSSPPGTGKSPTFLTQNRWIKGTVSWQMI